MPEDELIRKFQELEQENINLRAMYAKEINNLKLVEKELALSEAKFRNTFDKSPVGSVIVGLDKCFIKCNVTFCQTLGYSENELIGRSISTITYSEDLEIAMNEMKMMLMGQLEAYTTEKRYVRKDGSLVWCDISIRLVRDTDNTRYKRAKKYRVKT